MSDVNMLLEREAELEREVQTLRDKVKVLDGHVAELASENTGLYAQVKQLTHERDMALAQLEMKEGCDSCQS